MVEAQATRRLVAVLAADIAGYSSLMEADEEATVAAWKAARLDVIDPKIENFSGHIVKHTGDGFLAEFGSVNEAITCAIEMQKLLTRRADNMPNWRRMLFRMGVNLGDIVEELDDIHGDGVNIAARLEGLAEPGGICISSGVYEQVHKIDRFDVGYKDMGEQKLKNISEPVRVYRVILDLVQAGTVKSKTGHASYKLAPISVAILLAIVVIGGLWVLQPWLDEGETAASTMMVSPLPHKPSIAVLSFDDISDDKNQAYFADGMAEDIITDLSKISGLFVIARNSSFQYKGKNTDIRQIARELGVRYVLEGSVRRFKGQVRINSQLIDAQTGWHLWADRYDGTLDDIFQLQDNVTEKIVNALAVNLTPREKLERDQQETQNADAYDYFLRGWSHYRRRTPDDFAQAIPYFKKAIALDPSYARAHAAVAALYWDLADQYWSTANSEWNVRMGITMSEAMRQEGIYLKKALAKPTPLAHQVASARFLRQGRHDLAIAEAQKAIDLDPNSVHALQAMGTALIFAGQPSAAAKWIEQAMLLNPKFEDDYLYLQGLAAFGSEQYEVATEVFVNATRHNPNDDRSLVVLASAYGHLGELDQAKMVIEKANGLRRERQKSLPKSKLVVGVDFFLTGPYTLKDVDLWPYKAKADRERLRNGLRQAGVPEKGKAKTVSPLTVDGATTVTPAAAKALLDRGVTFIDVRPAAHWNNGHIPGAINLSLKTQLTDDALSGFVSKDQEVVFYCMGPRCLVSSKACKKAVEWGFKKVYYLREGYPGWKAAGYPLTVP